MKERERILKEITIDDDAPDLEKHDELEAKKKRLHCWILLKEGERGLTESFFVEPTTGRSYSIKDSPYQTIEAIFNHKNFWINLNPELKIQELNMDFEGNIEWEYVMLTEEDQRDDEGEDDDDEDALSDKEEDLKDILDMPPPWSPKLFIDRDKYLNLCPNGEKTVFYKKCRVDTYA